MPPAIVMPPMPSPKAMPRAMIRLFSIMVPTVARPALSSAIRDGTASLPKRTRISAMRG